MLTPGMLLLFIMMQLWTYGVVYVRNNVYIGWNHLVGDLVVRVWD
jgi:hypothetical protein